MRNYYVSICPRIRVRSAIHDTDLFLNLLDTIIWNRLTIHILELKYSFTLLRRLTERTCHLGIKSTIKDTFTEITLTVINTYVFITFQGNKC